MVKAITVKENIATLLVSSGAAIASVPYLGKVFSELSLDVTFVAPKSVFATAGLGMIPLFMAKTTHAFVHSRLFDHKESAADFKLNIGAPLKHTIVVLADVAVWSAATAALAALTATEITAAFAISTTAVLGYVAVAKIALPLLLSLASPLTKAQKDRLNNITQLEKLVNDLQAEITELKNKPETDLAATNKAVESLKAGLANLENQNLTTDARLLEHSKDIGKGKSAFDNLSTEIKDIKDELGKADQLFTQLFEKVAAIDTSGTSVAAPLQIPQDLQSKLDTLTTEVQRLQVELQASTTKSTTDVAELKAELEKVTTKITAIINAFTEKTSDNKEPNITTVRTRVADILNQ